MIKFLDESRLIETFSFAASSHEVIDIAFSESGDFMGLHDKDNYIMLFKRKQIDAYEYIGRTRTHSKVVGLTFGFKEKKECMLSVGIDGYTFIVSEFTFRNLR